MFLLSNCTRNMWLQNALNIALITKRKIVENGENINLYWLSRGETKANSDFLKTYLGQQAEVSGNRTKNIDCQKIIELTLLLLCNTSHSSIPVFRFLGLKMNFEWTAVTLFFRGSISGLMVNKLIGLKVTWTFVSSRRTSLRVLNDSITECFMFKAIWSGKIGGKFSKATPLIRQANLESRVIEFVWIIHRECVTIVS